MQNIVELNIALTCWSKEKVVTLPIIRAIQIFGLIFGSLSSMYAWGWTSPVAETWIGYATDGVSIVSYSSFDEAARTIVKYYCNIPENSANSSCTYAGTSQVLDPEFDPVKQIYFYYAKVLIVYGGNNISYLLPLQHYYCKPIDVPQNFYTDPVFYDDPVNNPGHRLCWHAGEAPPPTKRLAITLLGGTTTQPWHKKLDKNHNYAEANISYQAIVKDQNGQFQKNVGVTITTDVTLNSGGHVHSAGRYKGRLVDKSGDRTSTKSGKASIFGFTDGSGVFSFTFGSEEASGTHTITATCDPNPGCQAPATATVSVAIPDLMELGADPKSFELRGDKPWHPDNHYFSSVALFKIADFAAKYKSEFGNILKINDSSLEKGGVLDIKQTWTNPHKGHRTGIVVDINNFTKKDPIFVKFALDQKAIASWEDTPPHFHLRLLQRDE